MPGAGDGEVAGLGIQRAGEPVPVNGAIEIEALHRTGRLQRVSRVCRPGHAAAGEFQFIDLQTELPFHLHATFFADVPDTEALLAGKLIDDIPAALCDIGYIAAQKKRTRSPASAAAR